MRLYSVGFIICQIIVHSQTKSPSGANIPKRSKRNNEDEILQFSEYRYRLNPDYPKENSDLPVTFQAPKFEANNYWDYKREEDDYETRRTFFEDQRTTLPGIYHFMTSLFGGRDERDDFHHNRPPPTPPYPFEYPFGFRPTDASYIPPPKPIRASVIKLEAVTRRPSFHSPNYYDSSHLGSILNNVLIENSKKQHHQELGFHYQRDPAKPSSGVTPVLPKPLYVAPTTLRPPYSQFFDNRTRDVIEVRDHRGRNATGYRYPESVQDQLPHLNIGDVKIPYVSETALTDIFSTLSPQSKTKINFKYHRNPFLFDTTNPSAVDIRSLSWVEPTPRRRERPDINRIRFVDEAELTRKNSIVKKANPSEKNSVELISNLTVAGLSKVKNANIHGYINRFNMRNLIDYEMKKLGEAALITDNSSRLVNLNDELSLDAKILKDTNWDGITTGTASDRKHYTLQATVKPETEDPKPTELIVTEANTVTTTVSPETTTPLYYSTTDFVTTEFSLATTEASEPFTTTEEVTPTPTPTAQPRTDVMETTKEPPTTELLETTTVTEKPTTVQPKRKYHRRPKIVNFTPYPSTNDLQRKLINRNHFPKRQKPNITLAFGNKNIIKSRDSYGRDEVMKFSDEDVRKRKRKAGKRRQIIKRTRILTSERPIQLY